MSNVNNEETTEKKVVKKPRKPKHPNLSAYDQEKLEKLERECCDKLAHIDALLRYLAAPHMKAPDGIDLGPNGMPTPKEVKLACKEVCELKLVLHSLVWNNPKMLKEPPPVSLEITTIPD